MDVNSIINTIKKTFEKQKIKFDFKILDTNSLIEHDMISYKMDYEIMSATTPGNSQ